jgi:hypothetical protein
MRDLPISAEQREARMHVTMRWVAAVWVPVAALVLGCPSSPEEPSDPLVTGSLDQRRAAADGEFRRSLAEFEVAYDSYAAQRQPARTSDPTNLRQPTDFRPLGLFDGGSLGLCDTLRPYRGLIGAASHPYYFYGMSMTQGGLMVGQVGFDVVWDLWNQQAAVFGYGAAGIGSLVGAEGAAYVGFGFGSKTGVIDAWSGVFESGSLSHGIPVLRLAAGATGFRSSDRTVSGGAVSASMGTNVIPALTSGSVTSGYWIAWDAGTEALTAAFFRVAFAPKRVADLRGLERGYLQFASASDLALGLAETLVPTNIAIAIPATYAVALLKRSGLSIEELCPDEPDAGAPDGPPACPDPPPSCVCTYPADYDGATLCAWAQQQPDRTYHVPAGNAGYWGDQISCSPMPGAFCYDTFGLSHRCATDSTKLCCYSDTPGDLTVECRFADGSTPASILAVARACCQ